MTNAKSVKEWRKRHIKKGLCRCCNRKAVQGKTMCQYHLDYLKNYNKNRRKIGR